ncbi:MAG: NifU family protein [Saprospiraceae bacterium]|nr:NifU family protein [Saprospiraceae bacterium]
MSQTVKPAVMMYTEQTPNPESLKYVTNRMIYQGTADFKTAEVAAEWSPLANALFAMPYVKGVYISNNFVTVSKELNYQWEDIMLPLKAFIKEYLESGNEIISEGYAEAQAELEAVSGNSFNYSEADSEIVNKIRELIETYVKPAVEMDGGNIEFKHFQDGIVTVILQGSCSGCPSSTVTLKSGIEGMLKRMVPEVREVVSEMG